MIINSGLSDVTAETKVITGENYVSYPFYKASYCPVNTGTMVIPAQKLRMAKLKAGSRDIDSILTFTSKPLSIKVDELPDGVARMGKDGYRIVGKFTLSDSLLSTDIHAGDIVAYTLTVGGEGLTFPMDPPVMNASGIRSQLQDIIDSDTLIHDQLQCTKTFVYQVVFDSAGVYDFSRNIGFTYFNEVTEKLETLKSSRRVRAADVATTSYVELVKTFGSKNNFIAVDASTSMAIKDYMPHRLGAVKGALKEFLMSRDVCDIGLILFGGDAKHFALPTPDKCYTRRFLDSIDFNLNTRGTAIGDAIWLAKNSFAKNKLHKKLVIIGDGDNTAGRIPPLFAATLAKKYNITIYTIGVGTRGLVPYGRDETGKPFMIENTFTDGDFKTISSITNGRYYWAKDEKEVQRILKMIFP